MLFDTTINKEGNMKAWREEIETITSEMERNGSKLDAAMGKAKHSICRAVAALRVAGLPKNATDGECNYCGNTFPISSLVAAVRGEVPVLVCAECAREAKLEIL